MEKQDNLFGRRPGQGLLAGAVDDLGQGGFSLLRALIRQDAVAAFKIKAGTPACCYGFAMPVTTSSASLSSTASAVTPGQGSARQLTFALGHGNGRYAHGAVILTRHARANGWRLSASMMAVANGRI
jgi:hypothetical protein